MSTVPTTDPPSARNGSRWRRASASATTRHFRPRRALWGAGTAHCAHDNAYLVARLVDALGVPGEASFGRNVAWLRGLLRARDFPMEAFRRNLALVGDAVTRLRPEDAEEIARLVAAATDS